MSRRPPNTALRRALGRAIQQRRLAIGISQAELAARCRAVKATVGHMERGFRAPSLGMLAEMAWALNVEVWQLFKDASEMGEAT